MISRGLLLNLLLGLFALGQVARHFREAPQRAVLVAQCRDDDVGPELLSIFPHAPAFVFKAPILGCRLQFLLGQAPLHGLSRIKAGEVLADDLLGAIALEAFGARVPTGDMPAQDRA
jgi:hypothetical protein